MVQGIYVPAVNGDAEVREFTGLPNVEAAVCGIAKPTEVSALGITIFTNEEGILRRMPFNSRASFLWWYHVPGSRRAMLVGDAVIVGMPDRTGVNTDVPEPVRELFTTEEEYVLLVKVGGSPLASTNPASKLSSIMLPLIHGDPRWCLSLTRHEDYFTAAVWAQVVLERWTDALDTKIVKVSDLEAHVRNALP